MTTTLSTDYYCESCFNNVATECYVIKINIPTLPLLLNFHLCNECGDKVEPILFINKVIAEVKISECGGD